MQSAMEDIAKEIDENGSFKTHVFIAAFGRLLKNTSIQKNADFDDQSGQIVFPRIGIRAVERIKSDSAHIVRKQRPYPCYRTMEYTYDEKARAGRLTVDAAEIDGARLVNAFERETWLDSLHYLQVHEKLDRNAFYALRDTFGQSANPGNAHQPAHKKIEETVSARGLDRVIGPALTARLVKRMTGFVLPSSAIK